MSDKKISARYNPTSGVGEPLNKLSFSDLLNEAIFHSKDIGQGQLQIKNGITTKLSGAEIVTQVSAEFIKRIKSTSFDKLHFELLKMTTERKTDLNNVYYSESFLDLLATGIAAKIQGDRVKMPSWKKESIATSGKQKKLFSLPNSTLKHAVLSKIR